MRNLQFSYNFFFYYWVDVKMCSAFCRRHVFGYKTLRFVKRGENSSGMVGVYSSVINTGRNGCQEIYPIKRGLEREVMFLMFFVYLI